MASLHVARLAAISSYLLPVAAPRKIPHPHRGPAELGHYSSQTPEDACGPVALGDFEQIQERLTADTFQPIKKADLAPHPLKREPPWINRLCRGSFCRFFS